MTTASETPQEGVSTRFTKREALLVLAQKTQQDGWNRQRYVDTRTLNASVFGFPLSVVSNDGRVLEAAGLALSRFSSAALRRRARPLTLRIFVRERGRDPAVSLPLPADGAMPSTYDAHGDHAAIGFGDHGHCALNLATGEAVAFMSDALAARMSDVAHLVVSTSLLILMTRRGMVQWHAATVVRRNHAFMIIGEDNRGKSTTALALVHSGYQLLGESVTYTRRRRTSFEIMSFPAGYLQVRAGGLALFPELAAHAQPVVSDDGDKWRLDLRALFPHAILDRLPAAPRLTLLFVGVGSGPQTTLLRLSPDEALRRAIPACSLWEERPVLDGIIDEVVALVERVPAFEMVVGPDLASVVAAVDGLRQDRQARPREKETR